MTTDGPERPSPSTAAIRRGLTRCRAAYPQYAWPGAEDSVGWRDLARRWQEGCYGMEDEQFLQAVEDHLVGPYRQFTACPGQLWAAVDLRREAAATGVQPEPPAPPPPAPPPLTAADEQQRRIAWHMAEIRRKVKEGKSG